MGAQNKGHFKATLNFKATGKGRVFFIAWGRASELNYQLGLSVLQVSEMTGQEGLTPGWGTGSVLRILPHHQVILDTDCLQSIDPHKWAVRARCWWNWSVNLAPRMTITPPSWYSRLLKSRWGPACYQASLQHYAGKCSTTIWSWGGPFAALANFHGVNTPNHDGFQATSLTPFVWSRETQRRTLSEAFALHGDNRDK